MNVRTTISRHFTAIRLILAAALVPVAFLVSSPASAATLTQVPVQDSLPKGPILAAAVAASTKTYSVAPERGEGMIHLVKRTCGTSGNWQVVAAANNIQAPTYLVMLGATIHVSCSATAATTTTAAPATKTPAKQTQSSTTQTSSGWVHPLASGAQGHGGGCFGSYRSTPWVHYHQGVDMAAPSGTPIRAVHSGTIVVRGYQAGGAGNYIVVDHGNGYQSVYMHLVRPGLAKGTVVSTGETIGYVGATGDATGPHLHFEIHHGLWNRVNPATYMRSHGINIGC